RAGQYVPSEDRAQGLDSGADGYLLKPVSTIELVAHVRALLRIRRAEEARDVMEARLQDILDNAPAAVHVKDLEGRYLLVNRHWEERFHRQRAQVVGQCPHDVFPHEQADALLP